MFWYTRCACIKFLWIHVPRFNVAMRIQRFGGFIGIWAGFIPPVTLRFLFFLISRELTPTRFCLLYKVPKGNRPSSFLQIREFSRNSEFSISTGLLNDPARMVVEAIAVGWPRIKTRVRKLSPSQKPRMSLRSKMTQLRRRKQRPKMFLPFNRVRKKIASDF